MRLLCSRLLASGLLLFGVAGMRHACFAEEPTEAEWQEYVGAAKARGLRWTLAEYRPPPVPPENDAARLPVFASPQTFEATLGQVPVLKKAPVPKNGAPPSIDWKATRRTVPKTGLKIDPDERSDVRAFDAAVRSLQPIVDQLIQSKATAGNWNDEVWKGSFDAAFPHAVPAMRCFRLLQLRANLDLALSRPAEARQAVEAHLRLTRAISRTPSMILHLVTLAGLTLAHETVWRGMDNGAWDDDALRAFAREFLSWNAIAEFQWALETERAWSRESGERMKGDVDKATQALMYGLAFTESAKIEESELRKLVGDPVWTRANDLWYERSMDELATMLDPAGGVWRPIERKFDPKKLTKRQRERDLLSAASSVWSMPSFMEKAVWVQAHLQMAAIACGLELSRRATGKYPDSLEVLAPAHLPRIPVDPTTGAPFQYRVQADGAYLLYSVAFDRKDDGGKTIASEDGNIGSPDWRWFAPRRAGGKPSR